MQSMKVQIQTTKLIKRISREVFKEADVRSYAFASAKHYKRNCKHKKRITRN